jgi:hypothetical protein
MSVQRTGRGRKRGKGEGNKEQVELFFATCELRRIGMFLLFSD